MRWNETPQLAAELNGTRHSRRATARVTAGVENIIEIMASFLSSAARIYIIFSLFLKSHIYPFAPPPYDLIY